MDYKCLGQKIREQRNKLRLTQQDLAEAADISVSFMGQIERGDKILSLNTLVEIANALGTNVDKLLEENVEYVTENIEIEDEVILYLKKLNKKEKLYFLNTLKAFVELRETDV